MQAMCPRCSQVVPAEDINIQAMTALCRRCNEIFPVPAAAIDAPVLGIPAFFQVEEDTPRMLKVSWRWWRWQYLFLVFFCIAWDSFLIFWYTIAAISHTKAGGFQWFAVVFPIGHVAAGIGLTYFVIAALFNRTRIRADGDDLEITHGPIPWLGNRKLPLSSLEAIRVDAYSSNRRRMNQMIQFALAAVVAGRDVVLVKGLEEQQASWLQQKLTKIR